MTNKPQIIGKHENKHTIPEAMNLIFECLELNCVGKSIGLSAMLSCFFTIAKIDGVPFELVEEVILEDLKQFKEKWSQ